MAGSKPVRKAPPQKNELKPQYIPETGLYAIKYSGQGATPEALSGNYTTGIIAEKEIRLYLNAKKRA